MYSHSYYIKHTFTIRQHKRHIAYISLWHVVYFHHSWRPSSCAQMQQDWRKSKLQHKKHKNGQPQFQFNAYVVNKFYCELINQARKLSKYPLPVFVPEWVTGLETRIQAWLCHTITNYCFIWVCVPVSAWCVEACPSLCMCVWTQTKADDNTIIIYNQVNGDFLSVGWQKRSLFWTHNSHNHATSRGQEVKLVTIAFKQTNLLHLWKSSWWYRKIYCITMINVVSCYVNQMLCWKLLNHLPMRLLIIHHAYHLSGAH